MSTKKQIMYYVNYDTSNSNRDKFIKKLKAKDKTRIHKYITKNFFNLQLEMSR